MIRIYAVLLVLFSEFARGQDVHYSQFDQTKSLTNPALIFNQAEDYEIQLHRRAQWDSVTTPFNTFSISFNAKSIYKKLAAGTTILNDVSGDSDFSTKGLIFSLAKPLFNLKENVFSIGLQASFYQRTINYDDLIFLATEDIQNSRVNFLDVGLGCSNYQKLTKKSSWLIGASAYHLNRPRQSFYLDRQVLLLPKYIIHSTYYTNFNSRVDLSPAFYFSSQSQDKELIIGSGLTYKLSNQVNLRSGLYSRIKDAFFVTLGMHKANFEAMIAYDVNTSTLANASNNMGAFEFSIRYCWSVFKEKEVLKNIVCPKYL